MSEPGLFGAVSYELEAPRGCTVTLVVTALAERDALWLGDAFAPIDPWATYAFPASVLAEYFGTREPGAPRFLLTLGGTAVGALGLRLGWLRGPYMQFLGILPQFQRRGVGSAVLGWVEREARAVRERNLWVAASEINVEALRFYKRHGFVHVADLDGLVYDGRTEVLLRKRL